MEEKIKELEERVAYLESRITAIDTAINLMSHLVDKALEENKGQE